MWLNVHNHAESIRFRTTAGGGQNTELRTMLYEILMKMKEKYG
ncbi:MAG: hypothetical protein BWY04_01385 [candidate division CPR1 bacterium ADurb.Bin160]|uniref:Uncharacterized protein n=1 Tax=candidate division CPR1 bacterium ADurb.Bin160 TaxID=1852826 RepID=A0A1V5ZJK9_9BACT|nr:MAG: hypothetical protein BWY04_01385 [candidate division CPR1 bacterium ADurb.Bin160]